jgi:hypothetical protein
MCDFCIRQLGEANFDAVSLTKNYKYTVCQLWDRLCEKTNASPLKHHIQLWKLDPKGPAFPLNLFNNEQPSLYNISQGDWLVLTDLGHQKIKFRYRVGNNQKMCHMSLPITISVVQFAALLEK